MEPVVWEFVARAVGWPLRRINLAVRFDDSGLVVGFSNTLAQVTDQFLKRFELLCCGVVVVEIPNQADAERDVVEVIAVNMTSVDLPAPAVSDLDLAIA